MPPSASDEISRLGRLEGQVMGIAESVPCVQEELKRLKEKMMDLTRGISTTKEGLVHFSDSDSLELRSTVGRYEAKLARLRQARFDTLSPTLSRGPAEGSRAPVPVYYGDHCTLYDFLKLFQTWTLTHEAVNASATSEPIRVVGREWAELDGAHGREKVNPYILLFEQDWRRESKNIDSFRYGKYSRVTI